MPNNNIKDQICIDHSERGVSTHTDGPRNRGVGCRGWGGGGRGLMVQFNVESRGRGKG